MRTTTNTRNLSLVFKTEFPKRETTIITTKETGNLMHNNYCEIHFRNYVGYKDIVEYYKITGVRNAWYEIKHQFNYDYTMNRVKKQYKDSFNRVMKVEKIK